MNHAARHVDLGLPSNAAGAKPHDRLDQTMRVDRSAFAARMARVGSGPWATRPPSSSWAKAGIHNFTKALAQELAAKGIRVNAVAPGPIWTPLIPATMPTQKAQSHGESTLGRAGQPAEVAPAYVFFASQEPS